MSLNIVILDGYVANPGDISWEPVERHGKVTYYDRTPPEQVIERAKGADVILINKVKLGTKEFDQLPNLKLVCITASGTDNVDLDAAKQRNILVKNAVGYSTHAVAQHVFSLLLELTNNVALHNESVQKGEWASCKDFCYWKVTPGELYGKKFGIYGFGKIGQQVAKIADSFGMRVFVVSKHAVAEDYPSYRMVNLEEMFSQCDIVSLHAPMKDDKVGIINAKLLQTMKPGSFLINTARGGLINENDLKEALENGLLAGAALDVLSSEPPQAEHPLLGMKNCLITPHMAWIAKEARQKLIEITGKNIASAGL